MRASKEICIRRQPGKRYEIVCPSEDAPLWYFFRDWVPINSQLASVTWEKVTPNGKDFHDRSLGYRSDCCVPFKNTFLRLEEAEEELVKIRRGYIIHHLVTWFRNYVKDYQLDNNYPAMVYMVGYFR